MGHSGTEALGRPQLRLQAGVTNGPVPRLEWTEAVRPQLLAAPDVQKPSISHRTGPGLDSALLLPGYCIPLQLSNSIPSTGLH